MTLATLEAGDGLKLIGGVAAVLAAIVLLIVTAIAPAKVWRMFEAWRYEAGSAPTEAELARRRFGAILSLAIFAIVAIFVVNSFLNDKWDREAEALAEQHWDSGGLGLCVVPDIEDIDAYLSDRDEAGESEEEPPDTPISPTRYLPVDVEAETPPYLWRIKDSCSGDGLPPLTKDLIVGVDTACKVTSVDAKETASRVEVHVGGRQRVVGPYADTCSDPGLDLQFVLVDLDRPLGDRRVVDGATGRLLAAAG